MHALSDTPRRTLPGAAACSRVLSAIRRVFAWLTTGGASSRGGRIVLRTFPASFNSPVPGSFLRDF
jgi:hypothetical protein